jgi:imidazolonepropionase-like amidohydrolase
MLRRGRIDAILNAPPTGFDGPIHDATGHFLCPGLIDCHVHFFLDGGPRPRTTYLESDDSTKMAWARRNARTALEAGITTMRDCGGPAALLFEFQRGLKRGDFPGPHVISCGCPLMRPKGHCHFMGGEVATADDVRRRVAENLAGGATFVKLMASGGGLTPGTVPHEADLPLELMRLAADLAHANGLHITAHCHATESITRAIDAGLDMIEHVSYAEPPGRYRYDEDITRRIRDRGTIVSPTVEGALRTARRFRATGQAHNPGDLAAVERLEGRLTNTSHFYRLGMKIIGGTDAGVTDMPFGTLVDEILAYTRAGLSNAEALRTVTSDSASFLKLPRLGEVKVGYQADLALVAGNPFADLNALRRPLKVFLAGRLVHERPGEQGE